MLLKKKLAIAKKLKESGIDINIIVQATGLTEKRLTICNPKSTTKYIIKTSIKIE
jgi:2-iminoacetate synthase ThiH